MFGIFKRFRHSSGRQVFGHGHTAVRAFVAAETSRLLQPWTFDGGFSNGEIGASLSLIRSRSRDMAKNSEQYIRWLELFVANVVGTGFTLKASPLQMIGKPDIDDKAARFLQYHFWRWATNPKAADLTGRKTFAAICRLVAENWARDGEGIVLMERRADNEYGFALRVIRPDALDEGMNGAGLTPDTAIRNGVEVNRNTLRPVAYYFKANREDPTASYILNRPVIRVAAIDILHVFTQHDETQTRGVPLGHGVLRKLKMLDEYNVSELAAARDEANTLGIFKCTQPGQDGEIVDLNDDDEASAKLCTKSEPGTRYVLPKAWDYENHTPQHPNREVSAFKNSMLRDVASGLGIEYACFANDWAGVSFSSVRVGTLAERDHWRILQADFVEQFVAPVYLAWLRSFLTYPVGNPYVPSDFDRLAEFGFRGRRWEWVDPMKDVNAAVTAVDHGWKTSEQIAADYGGDIFENLEDNARVAEHRRKLGLRDPVIPGASNITDETTDDDDQGDDKADKPKPDAKKPAKKAARILTKPQGVNPKKGGKHE